MEVSVHPCKVGETNVCVCLKLCVAYLNTAPYNSLAEHLVMDIHITYNRN